MLELDLEALGFDELWSIHERLTKILSDRIAEEKLKLEKRLSQLNPGDLADASGPQKPGATPRRGHGGLPGRLANLGSRAATRRAGDRMARTAVGRPSRRRAWVPAGRPGAVHPIDWLDRNRSTDRTATGG